MPSLHSKRLGAGFQPSPILFVGNTHSPHKPRSAPSALCRYASVRQPQSTPHTPTTTLQAHRIALRSVGDLCRSASARQQHATHTLRSRVRHPIVHLTSNVACGGFRPPHPRSYGQSVPLRARLRPRPYGLRNDARALSSLVTLLRP